MSDNGAAHDESRQTPRHETYALFERLELVSDVVVPLPNGGMAATMAMKLTAVDARTVLKRMIGTDVLILRGLCWS